MYAPTIDLPPTIRAELDAGALLVINHSGGKDSQAMALALRSLGLPDDQVLVVHAELPDADWDGIPEHIEATLPRGWDLQYTRATKTLYEMVERRFASRPDVPSWPSASTRQCTSDLKRGPIDRQVRHWLKAHPEHNGRVVHAVGIRAEESASRAKAPVWSHYKRESKAGRQIHHWHPIHHWTERQVRDFIADQGQELHWAYGAGMTRLSCCFCIMASQDDLRTAARLRPALYQRVVDLEELTGWTMSMARRPLRDIVEG